MMQGYAFWAIGSMTPTAFIVVFVDRSICRARQLPRELEFGKLMSDRAVDLLRPASSHSSFYIGRLSVENFQPFAIAHLASFSVRFPPFGDDQGAPRDAPSLAMPQVNDFDIKFVSLSGIAMKIARAIHPPCSPRVTSLTQSRRIDHEFYVCNSLGIPDTFHGQSSPGATHR
jgi:hypothetical protein